METVNVADGWISPTHKVPEKGERVEVIVIKHMIYVGNEDTESSEWLDDGTGLRGMLFWRPLS